VARRVPSWTEHGSLFIAERLHLRSCGMGEASASLRLRDTKLRGTASGWYLCWLQLNSSLSDRHSRHASRCCARRVQRWCREAEGTFPCVVAQVAASGVTVKCATAPKYNVRNCTPRALSLAIGARRIACGCIHCGAGAGAWRALCLPIGPLLSRRKCHGQHAWKAGS
jgi:hypothetical protein